MEIKGLGDVTKGLEIMGIAEEGKQKRVDQNGDEQEEKPFSRPCFINPLVDTLYFSAGRDKGISIPISRHKMARLNPAILKKLRFMAFQFEQYWDRELSHCPPYVTANIRRNPRRLYTLISQTLSHYLW